MLELPEVVDLLGVILVDPYNLGSGHSIVARDHGVKRCRGDEQFIFVSEHGNEARQSVMVVGRKPDVPLFVGTVREGEAFASVDAFRADGFNHSELVAVDNQAVKPCLSFGGEFTFHLLTVGEPHRHFVGFGFFGHHGHRGAPKSGSGSSPNSISSSGRMSPGTIGGSGNGFREGSFWRRT